ncbi:ferredoxin--NAD(+) reductase [Methylorubrum extorquens]|uniref:ferredoxin--NAD(+) reductase n=1 Tax=Methylorubrum extorquens TaxID=408 RepID=UPI000158F838|nr:ferredoxin--NAD(+) reductase [Methylorubrum extorquens]ABY30426.1 putative ferredoxin-NAD reductase component [Methylorubrum extorquens PA1]KQP89164.1 ferredoxin-NAD reductase [Methylobacterium sp. Leaf119]WIU41712.1 ferredoxin--NAD(+) reductase [Methylorubrum extorquens]
MRAPTSARCSLVVNGQPLRVSPGDTSLETALADGMIGPMNGLLGQGPGPASRRLPVRARRAEAVTLSAPDPDATIRPVKTPVRTLARRTGSIDSITALAPRVLQVVATLERRLPFEPGDQVVVTLEGGHPVTLTPTLGVEGGAELNELVFHVRGESAEDLTALFGCPVEPGRAVKVKGPVGNGTYRPGGGRLVLVAAETGFAGIWAIARAARYIEPAREICLVVGARDPLDLYMRPSLEWLRATGVTRITLAADRHRQRGPDVRPGPLTAHIPSLRTTDVVHASGCPSTLGAVEVLAAAAGARFYPIPLEPGA